MEKIFQEVGTLPWYVWVAVVFAFNFIIRDKKQWSYRVSFNGDEAVVGVGKGDIDIAKYHRTDAKIEVELELEQKYRNKEIKIFLNSVHVFTVPSEKNSKHEIDYEKTYEHHEPATGCKLEVVVGEEIILSGLLKLN